MWAFPYLIRAIRLAMPTPSAWVAVSPEPPIPASWPLLFLPRFRFFNTPILQIAMQIQQPEQFNQTQLPIHTLDDLRCALPRPRQAVHECCCLELLQHLHPRELEFTGQAHHLDHMVVNWGLFRYLVLGVPDKTQTTTFHKIHQILITRNILLYRSGWLQ